MSGWDEAMSSYKVSPMIGIFAALAAFAIDQILVQQFVRQSRCIWRSVYHPVLDRVHGQPVTSATQYSQNIELLLRYAKRFELGIDNVPDPVGRKHQVRHHPNLVILKLAPYFLIYRCHV